MRLWHWLLGRDEFGYSRRERQIFRFHDGRGLRLGDPLALHRALVTLPGFDLEETAKVAAVPHLEGVKARGELAEAVRAVFRVAPLEAGGLTDGECLDLFCRFSDYLARMEADAGPLPSSPPPTAGLRPEAGTTATA